GRRLYTPAELDKLAIIRELFNAGYAASEIPSDIDKLWLYMRLPPERADQVISLSDTTREEPTINQRISKARTELFWRYFVSHTLRLSLMLICEDIPHTTAGLILPLEKKGPGTIGIHHVADV